MKPKNFASYSITLQTFSYRARSVSVCLHFVFLFLINCYNYNEYEGIENNDQIAPNTVIHRMKGEIQILVLRLSN